ncbi:MAG: hypothetical protein GY855_04015 [candidate division Zixibacteria bacterium]|nr:hypothetical protein [candidate division Zixibacteria bacterium]
MNLVRLALLTLVIMMFIPSMLWGQCWWNQQLCDLNGINFNPSGSSTRAKGMGNAYMAIADDATGVTWNPAGAAFIKDDQGTVEFLTNATKLENTNSTSATNSFDYNTNNNIFSSFGYMSPIRFSHRDFTIGVNYYRIYDFSKDYSINMPNRQEDYYMKFGVEVVKFTAATQVVSNISFGFNGNIYIRGFTEDFIQREPTQNWIIGNDTVSVPWHLKNKVSFSGANFDFGLQGRFGGLSIGAVVSTPFKIRQESNLLAAQVVPHYGEQGAIFNNHMKIEIPIGIGGGLAYNANKFTVSADLWTQKFSESRHTIHPFFSDPYYTENYDPSIPNVDYNPYWQDITQYRFGAEYLLQISNIIVPIRLGYRNDPKVFSDEDRVLLNIYNQPLLVLPKGYSATPRGSATSYETNYLDQVVGSIISFGTGLEYRKYKLDIAYEFGSSEQNVTSYIIDVRDFEDDQFVYGDLLETREEIVKEKTSKLYISVSMMF